MNKIVFCMESHCKYGFVMANNDKSVNYIFKNIQTQETINRSNKIYTIHKDVSLKRLIHNKKSHIPKKRLNTN